MAQLNPYLSFNGNCREAMNFYKECLGGELSMQTIGETPMGAQCADGQKDQIMHSVLQKGEFLLMGSDMSGPDGYIKGNTIGLAVNCTSAEELHAYFLKLSDGGHVIDAVREQFWGGLFGALTDKFGVRWMFNYEKKN